MSNGIAHFPLDIPGKQSVSSHQRRAGSAPVEGSSPLPRQRRSASAGLRWCGVMARRDQVRTDMIKNQWGVSAHSRWATKRRSKPVPHCEWDWPPERRFLHSSPLIDADPPCGSGGSGPMDRRIADVVLKVIVGAIKVAVVVVILFVWLVYLLLRI